MAVCARCKSDNDDFRLRCGKCGNTLSKRGDYKEQQGPRVVVLGSIEDLRRAQQQGEIDTSEDDPTALGWLDSDEIDHFTSPLEHDDHPKTRRVSVREIDKISGLRDLRDLQALLLGEEGKPGETKKEEPKPEIKREEFKREERPKLEEIKKDDARPGTRKFDRGFVNTAASTAAPTTKPHPHETPPRAEPRTTGRHEPIKPEAKHEPAVPTFPSRTPPGRGFSPEPAAPTTPPPQPRPAPPEPAREPEPSDMGEIPEESAATAPTAYLANELLVEPFALAPDRKYLIGRDPRASIFLPSSQVSRRHAGLASDNEGAWWVEDLRSSNGTYVNGRAVIKRRLRDGDLVDVGSFTLHFVTAKPGQGVPDMRSDPGHETAVMRALPGALMADIEKNSVVAILVLISSGRRSGVVTLRAGPHVGRIFMVDGQVHHAQFGKKVGEEALAALLPAEIGLLHFSDERIKVKRTINRSTAEIINGTGSS